MGWQRPDGRDPQELRSHRFQRHFTSGMAGSPVLQCGEESSFSNFSCLRL
jgi:ribonuclease PH